ncbi:MAG: methyltransferase domain-containing protein [Bacteroidota bacterium]
MFINTDARSTASEIMDDLDMEGDLLRRSLDKLDWINKWLGGNQITLSGLEQLLQTVPKTQTLTIVDVGCGSGDMLRIIAQKMRTAGRTVQLIGIDANAFTVDYARQQSLAYPEITYHCCLVPSAVFDQLDYDILLSTLFLHHLTNEEIIPLLKHSSEKARLGIIVNDLHRSKLAYFLFQLLTLFIPNPMIRQDGLTSILRGFKIDELRAFTQQNNFKNSTIRWRWAFRYQWIIDTRIKK